MHDWKHSLLRMPFIASHLTDIPQLRLVLRLRTAVRTSIAITGQTRGLVRGGGSGGRLLVLVAQQCRRRRRGRARATPALLAGRPVRALRIQKLVLPILECDGLAQCVDEHLRHDVQMDGE